MEFERRIAAIEAALALLGRGDVPESDRERARQELSKILPALAQEHRCLQREMEHLADLNTKLTLQRDLVLRVLQGNRPAAARPPATEDGINR